MRRSRRLPRRVSRRRATRPPSRSAGSTRMARGGELGARHPGDRRVVGRRRRAAGRAKTRGRAVRSSRLRAQPAVVRLFNGPIYAASRRRGPRTLPAFGEFLYPLDAIARLEPHLRQARLPPVPVRAARCRGAAGAAPLLEAISDARGRLVPRGAEDAGRRGQRASVLPDARLYAGARLPAAAAAWTTCSAGWPRSRSTMAGGSISPRTPCWTPSSFRAHVSETGGIPRVLDARRPGAPHARPTWRAWLKHPRTRSAAMSAATPGWSSAPRRRSRAPSRGGGGRGRTSCWPAATAPISSGVPPISRIRAQCRRAGRGLRRDAIASHRRFRGACAGWRRSSAAAAQRLPGLRADAATGGIDRDPDLAQRTIQATYTGAVSRAAPAGARAGGAEARGMSSCWARSRAIAGGSRTTSTARPRRASRLSARFARAAVPRRRDGDHGQAGLHRHGDDLGNAGVVPGGLAPGLRPRLPALRRRRARRSATSPASGGHHDDHPQHPGADLQAPEYLTAAGIRNPRRSRALRRGSPAR